MITSKTTPYLLIAALVLGLTGTAGYIAYDRQPGTPTLNLSDGQTEVPLEQPLVVSLSHPAPVAALIGALHIEPWVQGTVESGAGGRRFTFKPVKPWSDLTVYTVRLDPLQAGPRQIAGHSWRFRTTIVPRLVSVGLEGGAVLAEGAEVPIGATLRATFNDTLDQAGVGLLLNGKPAELTWLAGGEAATFQTTGYPSGPLELTLGPGGRDLRGRPLSSAWSLHLKLVFRLDLRTVPLKLPAVVQIPNERTARDQSGLTAADAVFEYLTEGGITRLSAIFTRAPDAVGPVRSGRLISISLARHYRGQLFASGLSDGTMARLKVDPVPATFDNLGRGFYRSPARPAPDNLYIAGSAIQQDLGNDGDPTQLKKSAPAFKGDEGGTVSVAAHNTTYAYDPKAAAYLKTEDGHPFTDALNGKPLRITMVVVMRARSTPTTYVEDVAGAHGLDFDLNSGGRADFYYQGKHAAGTWAAPDRNSALTFKTDAGEPVTLPDGLVWLDVV